MKRGCCNVIYGVPLTRHGYVIDKTRLTKEVGTEVAYQHF